MWNLCGLLNLWHLTTTHSCFFCSSCPQFQLQMFDIVCTLGWTSRDRCCDLPSMVRRPESDSIISSLVTAVWISRLIISTEKHLMDSFKFSPNCLSKSKFADSQDQTVFLFDVGSHICWAPLASYLIERSVAGVWNITDVLEKVQRGAAGPPGCLRL